jgi:hypothetical protein
MNKQDQVSFKQAWLCEAIHLRESQWGPQDDSKAILLAQNELSPLAKVIHRAQELSRAIGLTNTITKLSSAGWLALILMMIVAIIAGASIALTALGNGTQPVNIVWALVALLGLNLLSLILWCLALFSPTASGGRLAQLWPWLTRKLARGPNMGLAVQAWWSVWHQARATRWLLSTGTHLIWLTITLVAAVTMLLVLSTRQYDFVWETTLLSSDVFVKWIGYLSIFPQWFGFAAPDSETVRASGSVSQYDAETARRLWSEWLFGCLLVYGFLPRSLLAVISGLFVIQRISHVGPDLSSPYYLSVLSRMPSPERQTEGREPGGAIMTGGLETQHPESEVWNADHIMIAIELDPTDDWPPPGLGTALSFANNIDSGESRKQALANMNRARPKNLVLACDARHSPDRGTMRLIANLSEHSKRTLLWLRHSQAAQAHTEAWVAQLRNLPQVELKIRDDAASVMQWLERHHD